MSDDNSLTPPKPTPADWAHLGVKAVLSAIPYPCVGGPAAEFFAAIFRAPVQKRLEQWREDVAAAIRKLQESSVEIGALLQDEGFATMIIQATVVVLRNHHQEKREALRNAIVNAALSTQGATDIHLAFVRFVDELSPAHVRLLRAIKYREGEIAPLKSYPEIYHLISKDALGQPTTDLFKMYCLELESRGLIRISPDIDDFPGIYEASAWVSGGGVDLPRICLSEVGANFLAFISDSTTGAASS
jgi:hypothetical protein